MTKMRSTKRALFSSAVALLLCFSMLLGTTYAWFTDSVTSTNNIITSGNLDVELYYQTEGQTDWTKVTETTNVFKADALWEPGYTEVVKFKVVNEGSLALKYILNATVASEVGSVNESGEAFKLSDFIKFGVVDGAQSYTRDNAIAAVDATATALKTEYNSAVTELAAKNDTDSDEKIVTMVVYMPTTVGNDANYKKGEAVPTIHLGINLVATQVEAESDAFGTDYDKPAPLPEVAHGTVAGADTEIPAGKATVNVPAAAGDGKYTFTIANVNETTNANDEVTVSFDLALEKDGAAVVEQAGVEYEVTYHVGTDLQIIKVRHNGVDIPNYTYDPATGDITFKTSSFSPFEIVYIEVPAGAHKVVVNGKTEYFLNLYEAVAAVSGETAITLGSDVTLTETLVFDKDATVSLDMNGFTVSGQLEKLVEVSDGTLSVMNGSFKNVHDAAVETKYSIYMSGDAKAEIKGVNIETTGIGIMMTDDAHITELNANIDSYITVSGYCSFDAVSMEENAKIDLISGGTYKTYFAESMFEAKLAGKSMSYNQCYTINLNSAGAYIGEISGGTFIGAMDTANNGTPIHVNNGTVALISGGYFGFAEKAFADAIYVLYANTAYGGKIEKITGGTYEKGHKPADVPRYTGYGCDFENIVAASGCKVELTGETVVRGNQLSTKVKEVTLDVVRVVPQ